MAGKSKFKKVITIVKLSVLLTGCWPLSNNASKFMMSCKKLYTYLSIILALGFLAPLIYGATKHLSDSTYLINSEFAIMAAVQVIWNIVFQTINYRHIQVSYINIFEIRK